MPNPANSAKPRSSQISTFDQLPPIGPGVLPEVSIIGCGWLGFAVAQRLIQLDTRVAGSTTTTQKLAGLRSIGVDSALLRIDPPTDSGADPLSESEPPAHRDSAPLKRLFAAPQLVVTIPPGRFDEEAQYALALKELLIRWAPPAGAHLIFVSSTSVYGDAQGPVDETTEARPVTTSAQFMRAGEISLSLACELKNVRLSILRSAGQIGFGRHPGRFFADKTGVPDPDLPVNIVHQADLAECVVQLLRTTSPAAAATAIPPQAGAMIPPQAGEMIFNACARQHPTRREFYQAASQTIQLRAPTFTEQDPTHLPGKLILSDKIRTQTAVEFKFDDLMAIATGRLS